MRHALYQKTTLSSFPGGHCFSEPPAASEKHGPPLKELRAAKRKSDNNNTNTSTGRIGKTNPESASKIRGVMPKGG